MYATDRGGPYCRIGPGPRWPGLLSLGLDPLSLRPTGALAKNGVVDLGTGRLRTYFWPVMANTFGRQTLEHMVCFN
jgi:hypothetical protein